MESSTELLLRVNGIQAAFGFEFGLDCPRANEGRAGDPYRQANVSYSLVQRQDGQVMHEVLITHPHFDHFAQLDWLSMCVLRSGRPDQPRPLPIYASQECWENGPNRIHRYLTERSDVRPLESDVPVVLGDEVPWPEQDSCLASAAKADAGQEQEDERHGDHLPALRSGVRCHAVPVWPSRPVRLWGRDRVSRDRPTGRACHG